MRFAVWSTRLKCLVFVLVWLLLGVGVASAAVPKALGGTGSSPLESPLVVSEVNQLFGGQPAQEAEEAQRASPEAVAARDESELKYQGLNSREAVKLAGETFPRLIDQPTGGPPALPSGEAITGFPSVNAARVDLGSGRHGVTESSEPIAVEQSPGQRVPVDLALREAGGLFEPQTPLTGVRIPKQLNNSGVQLLASGVSLTPVTARDTAVEGSEGVIDDASVLYPNTQRDSDTVVKPTTFGFEMATLLRSVDSPNELFFHVDLPAGATLEKRADGTVQIVKNGAVIAVVESPMAVDATGVAVPVSMSVSGGTLVLVVEMTPGDTSTP